jgi:HD-like signal output (HDOD) protein
MTSAMATHSEVSSLKPPPHLIDAVKRNESQLRMLPQTAIQAMQLSKNPRCCITDYAAIIERDVKLATDILALTNSAAYSPTTRVVSLQQAVVRLGFRECENLILASSVLSLMRRMSVNHDRVCSLLWPHCHRTAFLAARLNIEFRLGFHGEEFVAGLIHDFGRALFAVADPKLFAEVDPLDFDDSPDLLIREETAFGMNHGQFAAWYVNQQRLPSPIPEVILHHHQPEFAADHLKLASLIAVTDHMANHLQRFNEAASYDLATNSYLPGLIKLAGPQFEKGFPDAAPLLMEQALTTTDAIAG